MTSVTERIPLASLRNAVVSQPQARLSCKTLWLEPVVHSVIVIPKHLERLCQHGVQMEYLRTPHFKRQCQTWKAVVSIHLPEWLNKWVSCRSHIDSAIDLMACKTHAGNIGTFCSSKARCYSMLSYGIPWIPMESHDVSHVKTNPSTVATFFDHFAASFVDTELVSPGGAVVVRHWSTSFCHGAIAPSRREVWLRLAEAL